MYVVCSDDVHTAQAIRCSKCIQSLSLAYSITFQEQEIAMESVINQLLLCPLWSVITVVSRKSTHGQDTLQVCQRGALGIGALLSVSTFNHERVSMSRLHALEANNRTNNNQPPAALKMSPGSTQHSELHHVTMSMV